MQGAARAEEATLPELRTAAQVRQMPAEQAERHYPVRLKGVVTYFDQRVATKAYRFIQDETTAIYFYVNTNLTNLSLTAGQLIELVGVTGQGEFAPVVMAHQIRVLGQGKFPEARPLSPEALATGQEDSQFVETHGIIHSAQFDAQTSNYILEMATSSGHITLYAGQIPTRSPEDLVDGNVLVRGICITRFNLRRQLFAVGMLVPRLEDIAVEQAPAGDPFAMPAQPIKNILQFKWGNSYGHRVKVEGRVTLCYADKMYLQDETEGMAVQTKQAGEFRVGDRVQALGFPAKGDYNPTLQSAVCRKLEPAPSPQPEPVTVDEARKGPHDCRLVSIDALLLDRAQESNESFLILQAEKFVFHAHLKQPGHAAALDALRNGSKVRVTGVCLITPGADWYSGSEWRAESFRILLRSSADVTVLVQPPWWTLQRMLVAVGLLCAVILTAMGWVLMLRRRVDQQTQIIEEKLQAEAAIKARYVELFENANDVVFTHDREGRLTSINQTGALLLQRKQEDILSRNLVDLVVEEQRPAARQWLEQVVAGAESSAADWDFMSADGRRLKLEINSRRIDQDGEFIEVEGIARDATERKRLEREILEVAGKEQQRLGHDLHDGVCQQLAAIAYRTHILARSLSGRGVADSCEAQEIGKLINESLLQTRAVARGLFPVRLEAEGLVSALDELASSTSRAYQIKCDFSCSGAIPQLNNALAMHIYYITQEALLNAAKHGRAQRASVQLKRLPDGVLLTVQDDGVGFRPADNKQGGMGIGIMRYRAKVIGASLDLKSEPGRGTTVSCKIRLAGGESNGQK